MADSPVPENPVPAVPDSCQLCPNRKRSAAEGKWAAYIFALLVSGFLAYQCISHDRKGDDVPPLTWMFCLVSIGTALGVQIDPASFTDWIKGSS